MMKFLVSNGVSANVTDDDGEYEQLVQTIVNAH